MIDGAPLPIPSEAIAEAQRAGVVPGTACYAALVRAQLVLLAAWAGDELAPDEYAIVSAGLAALLGEGAWPVAIPPVGAALATRAPALDRWRRAVLAHPRQHPPVEVAAAWELTALECEAEGETEGAWRALRQAERAVRVQGAA